MRKVFAGTAYANDDLSQGTVEFKLVLFLASAPVLDIHLGLFVFLVCQYFEYDVLGHVKIGLKIAGTGNKKECNSQEKCGKMQYFES